MVSNTTNLCKPMLRLFEEIKNNLTLGFFILNKSLELRLRYHFVTLKSGIAWCNNLTSLMIINHGLS